MIPLPPGRLRDALAPLRGKVLRLEIAGLGFGPQFTLDSIGLRPSFARADVTVRASFADYVALVRRREDPDTLCPGPRPRRRLPGTSGPRPLPARSA